MCCNKLEQFCGHVGQAGGTQSCFRGVQSERQYHRCIVLVLHFCRSREHSRGWASSAE